MYIRQPGSLLPRNLPLPPISMRVEHVSFWPNVAMHDSNSMESFETSESIENAPNTVQIIRRAEDIRFDYF